MPPGFVDRLRPKADFDGSNATPGAAGGCESAHREVWAAFNVPSSMNAVCSDMVAARK